MAGAPDEGTCWTVPADAAADPKYWFDDSSQVPCSEPHTTETVQVLRLEEPTVVQAKREVGPCWNWVRLYLGVDLSHWVHWGWKPMLPSREEIADGASWIRCDVVFPSWDWTTARSTTGDAEGVAVNPPVNMWTCLDEDPDKAKQPLVPCDQPHQYEETGILSSLEDLDEYPSPAELNAAAKRQCTHHLPADESQVAVTAHWDPRSSWREGDSIAGACFMFNKNGQALSAKS
jgi:hypothetical protein